MLQIPIQDVPSQTLNVNLANQAVTLKIYQKSTGLFVDVYVSGALVAAGALAREAVPLVREAYRGLVGDLVFFDTQEGGLDPQLGGLGTRWVLNYLEAGE